MFDQKRFGVMFMAWIMGDITESEMSSWVRWVYRRNPLNSSQ